VGAEAETMSDRGDDEQDGGGHAGNKTADRAHAHDEECHRQPDCLVPSHEANLALYHQPSQGIGSVFGVRQFGHSACLDRSCHYHAPVSGLVSQVENYIQRHGLLRTGQKILVAVSGGVDSMVLLDVLHELAGSHGWRLVGAHFHHGLRSRASLADEALVRRAARQWRLPCAVDRGNVKALAHREGVSLEMAARQMRHEFLARVARRRGIRTVALAHHADDRVELFFLRLLRGAGVEGLAGMKCLGVSPVDRRVRLVRPLFELPKAALRAYAEERRVPFREDASNHSPAILRNRVRRHLLPTLRRRYQPALDRVVLRLLNLLDDTSDFLEEAAEAWKRELKPKPFDQVAPAVQRAILLAQLHELGVKADYDLVEELRHSLNQPITVAPGRRIRRDASGRIGVEPRQIRSPDIPVEVSLAAGTGQTEFAGVRINWRALPGPRLAAAQPGREFFDLDRIGRGVVLRHWQPGDRFQPIGLPQTVKLQDWFTNRKVPRTRRHELVVATTDSGEIFWIEDQRIAAPFKVTGETRRRLRWEWERG
jgi:tRNA(Ile)-lysidine synthase